MDGTCGLLPTIMKTGELAQAANEELQSVN